DLINTILFSAGFILLFASAEVLYYFFKVRAEFTRKYVHVASGLITLLFPLYLDNHWYVLLLCSSFAILLLGSMRLGLLKAINAVERKTWGSVAFPAAVYGCYLAFAWSGKVIFFYQPILIMAFADPVAALVGKKWPKGLYKIGAERKSLSGSSAFFIIAFIISFALLKYDDYLDLTHIIFASFASALLTAFTEGISRKGMDNITIPVAALIVLYCFYFVL
ncbi:MAG: phosphatidate cytidylyltransferase, partial [Bacteroidia bacterium]